MHDGFTSGRPSLGVATRRRIGVLANWLSIDVSEASFATRGFVRTNATPRLEAAWRAFIAGYNFALACDHPNAVLRHISSLAQSERGFAAEGAAMAAAMRTALMPWSGSLRRLLNVLDRSYPHLAHVGVGWSIARIPIARSLLQGQCDSRLMPLTVDGRGFHDGYFHGFATATRKRPAGAWGAIYDQGLGRSLWFAFGADPISLEQTVAGSSPARWNDLWAGIGLAAAYACGAEDEDLDCLAQFAGPSLKWLRQGAAFAISAHGRAGFVPEQSSRAANRLCKRDVESLTRLVDRHFADSAAATEPEAYQLWRTRIADDLEHPQAACCSC